VSENRVWDNNGSLCSIITLTVEDESLINVWGTEGQGQQNEEAEHGFHLGLKRNAQYYSNASHLGLKRNTQYGTTLTVCKISDFILVRNIIIRTALHLIKHTHRTRFCR